MKKLILILLLALSGASMNAQSSNSIAIQFYVDANNNCVYNSGEQLIYNVPFRFIYKTGATTTATLNVNTYCVTTCGSHTIYAFTSWTPATNTLVLTTNSGISANLGCGSYNNLLYNSNTLHYLPVTITTTNGIGTQVNYMNYYSSTGTYTYGNFTGTNNSMGVCSNIGTDSIALHITMFNFLTCSPSGSMSPRTYSLYFDGAMYDKLTTTGGFFSNTYTTGINNMSHAQELYYGSATNLYLYPKLPTTFTAIGSHTFQIRSSQIYNATGAAIDFSCVINSIPCSKISGRFYNDCNNNCTFDGPDNYGMGFYATGKLYNSSAGFNLIFHPNPVDGRFSLYAPSGNSYSLTQYPTYTNTAFGFTACTTGTTTIPPSTTTSTLMFGYRNNMTTVQDPYAFFIRQSSTSASLNPGTGVIFGINLYNMWSNLCSTLGANPGQVKFIFTNSMNYVNSLSGPTPTLLTGSTTNTLVWNVASFPATAFNPPFASFSVAVSPTAVPGSTVIMGISITPSVDVNLGNNAYTLNRVIGGPFDPNGKWLESPGLLASGDVIHGTTQFNYNIGFQNVGTGPAINVITMDTIDNNFDLNTLEVLQSSYPVSFQVDQATRLVQFHFDGINLPAAMSDEPKSHGFVRYGIRLKPGVPANTVLKNRAHNIFDFNEPVATNQTANKLVVVSAVSTFGEDGAKVVAVPNPFSSLLTITSSGELRTITVSDLSGRVVMEKHTSGTKVELDFNDYPQGLYLVQVNSAEGHVSTIKVIKE